MVTGMGRLREREFVPGERYKFTSKEQDPETGLYYFGARYYEPRLSRWISTDPAVEKYLPKTGKGKDDLPGLGGVFNPVNMNVYNYAGNNPVIMLDPDGNTLVITGSQEQVGRLVGIIEKASGTRLYYIQGSDSMNYKATITGFTSVDNRFSKQQGQLPSIQKALSTIIDTNKPTVTVRFDSNDRDATFYHGGGSFDVKTGVVALNEIYSLNDQPNAFYGLKQVPAGGIMGLLGFNRKEEVYMTSWDSMA